VYDVLGNELATLIDEFKTVGNYSVTFNAGSFASGLYFYKMEAITSNNKNVFREVRKMILLK